MPREQCARGAGRGARRRSTATRSDVSDTPARLPRTSDRPRSPAASAASKNVVAVHHQRLAGVDRQRGRAGGLHRLDRRDADHRHVEPHVLLRLGHLDDARPGPGDLAGAADHRVGPFHRLDRDHRLVLHDDRLADVERRDGVGHAVAEGEVLELLGDRRPRGSACPPWPAAAPGRRSSPAARCPRRAALRRPPRSARRCSGP